MSFNSQDKERLAEIFHNILDQANEALDIIRVNDRREYERAKGYYLGHILASVGDENYMEQNTLKKYLERDLGRDAEDQKYEGSEEDEEELCEEDD